MTIRPIIIAPDPRLKTKSSIVETIDDSISELVRDMFETMYYERGIGLAAVQIGIHKRVLVADVEWNGSRYAEEEGADEELVIGKQHVLINPQILNDSGDEQSYKEGCLSFPDQFADIIRPSSIRVKFTDLDGKDREESFDGLLATCIQHEIDHLNGITFVDHISPVKRDMITRRLTKMKKAGAFDHDHDHHHVHDENCNHG
ncbi:MAG: peptide deformylase [Pseudomonadota bacterium]